MIGALKPLVMMQLKDKIDLSFLHSKKQTISKVVLSILALVVITVAIYFVFWACKFLNIFSLVAIVPVSVVVVVFTIMQILSIITCTYGLMKTLYFSKDNQFLLTMPVHSNLVFFSKMIVFYFYELLKNLYFLIPLFIAYGISSGFSIFFYPWMILCFILISALPVVIGALLSIPCMFIASALKKMPITRIILFCGIVLGIIIAIVKIISLIPANIDIVGSWGTLFWEIQDFLSAFTKYAFPFTWIVNMLVGTRLGLKPILFNLNTLYVMLSLIGFIAVILIVCYFLSRPLFFKMASKPFEYKKKLMEKEFKNKKTGKFLTSLKKETIVNFRTSDVLYGVLSICIALPILILLLNKIFASMSTRLLGEYMTISFNLLIILLVVLASNNAMASVMSKEGSAGYLIKTRPASYLSSIFSKLIFQFVFMLISIIATIVVYSKFTTISNWNIFYMFLIVLLCYSAHLLWSVELDIMNPQTGAYATIGSHVKNPNETKSNILAFFISFLIFGVSLFLFIENMDVALFKVMLISAMFLVVRIYLFVTKVKIYYMEKS